MAYLTINSIEVPCGQASVAHVRVGTSGVAFPGHAHSSTWARKREWTFTTAPLSRGEVEELRGLLNGTIRTAAGDFAPDESISVRGQLERVRFEQLAGGIFGRVTFTIREV